ncbi:hypothetical protein AB4356_14240 [Vibrio lentus]
MTIFEVDYGLGPLKDVENALLSGITTLSERHRRTPGFDGLWMNEYGSVLYGALFVAAQAYCIGSLRDINDLRASLGLSKLTKNSAYSDHHITSNECSLIELVNSAANYFKHREEWNEPWPRNYTTGVLEAFSMDCDFPINEVYELIEVTHEYGRLSNLLSEWRENLINKANHEKT